MGSTSKILGALLLGTVIGGTLGILLAPSKGSQTRKKISREGEDLTDALQEQLTDLLGNVKRQAQTVTKRVLG